jgi:hypothetical protein
MAFNTRKRIFDVHIIESNRSGRSAEGEALGDVLRISGICTHHYPITTVDELRTAFETIARHPRCLSHHRHFLPFLHFALHATEEGIFVAGRKLVQWRSLLELLAPLRERLEGNLFICMSACAGFYAYQLACSQERFTYHFLVGTRSGLDWRDSVLAFHIFYHSLFVRRTSLPDAVTAMNIPLLSRRYSFDYTFGSEVKRLYHQHRAVDERLVAIRGRGN